MEFESSIPGSEATEHIYQTRLSEIDLLETTIFNVSAMDLKEYDLDLYFQFIYFPA
jgi:hypothetical protein